MSEFDPYYEWLGIPLSDQPSNHYRLLSIPVYESNTDVIKSAAERQTMFLRSFQSGEQGDAAAKLLNEVAAARVCLLNVQDRKAYDTHLRFSQQPVQQPVQPVSTQISGPLAGNVNPALRIPDGISSRGLQNAPVQRHKFKVRRKRVKPVWQRPSVVVPVGLVSLAIAFLLVFFGIVKYDTPIRLQHVVTDKQSSGLRPPVTAVKPKTVEQPRSVAPIESTPITNSNDGRGTLAPVMSADDTMRFITALNSAREFQVQRKLSDAAAQLVIAKHLESTPQYSSGFNRAAFIQQMLEQFTRLTTSAIDEYTEGSVIRYARSKDAVVVAITSSTLTIRAEGENKEYLRNDLSLGIAMGIADTNFGEGPWKGFMQAAFLLTSPEWKDSYLVKGTEYWAVGDASLAPAGTFAEYRNDYVDVDSPKLLGRDSSIPTGNMRPDEHSTSLPILINSIDMQLVRVPSGTFMMGSPESEPDRQKDETEHQVTITRDFFMQTTEVTQEQWKTVMDTEPWKRENPEKPDSKKPATYVSWNEAIEFCTKLTAAENNKYRLPTEAEWEYACRAGARTAWSFGDQETALVVSAWFKINSSDLGESFAHPTATKEPKLFGLYDLHGNVWEWCHDRYSADYHSTGPFNDPHGATVGTTRVLRGGSWDNEAELTRSAHRHYQTVDFRGPHAGFRVVQELSVDDPKLAIDSNSDAAMTPLTEQPDNPLVFTIALAKQLSDYRLKIPYVGNVETANITVQFEVTARGTRPFHSESKQQGPVRMGKSYVSEITIGKYTAPPVANSPAKTFNLVGDVLARLSYDSKTNEFTIYVKPTADVVAGQPQPIKVGLSAQQCAERAGIIDGTIVNFTNQINVVLPQNFGNGAARLVVLKDNFNAAVAAQNGLATANLGTQIAAVQSKLKGLSNSRKSMINRLPSMRFKSAYLKSLAANVDDLKHLDIRYRIYQKVGDENKLIIDGW